MGVTHLLGGSSGNRFPMVVNGDTHQALPPLPLSSSFTSAVLNNLCSWELEWCFGVMEAFGLPMGASGWSLMIWDIQEVISLRSWFPLDLKLFKICEIRGCWTKEHSTHLTGSGSLLFPCLKSRQPPPAEFSGLGISWMVCSPTGYLRSTRFVWMLQPKIRCFCYYAYWGNSRTTQVCEIIIFKKQLSLLLHLEPW